MRVYSPEETVSRVRSLLKCVSSRGSFAYSPGQTAFKLNNINRAAEKWKAMFRKYDVNASNDLDFNEVKSLIRHEFHLAERKVSDWDLKQLFDVIDVDRSGTIDLDEWLMFVQQGKIDTRSPDEIVMEVRRATRLTLRRNEVKHADLEDLFNHYEDPSSGKVDDFTTFRFDGPHFRIFFRSALKVCKHDCRDSNLKTAFKVLDSRGSGYVTGQELKDFLFGLWQVNQATVNVYSKSINSNRKPSIFSSFFANLDAPAAMPFNAIGRNVEPRSRFCTSRTSFALQPQKRSFSGSTLDFTPKSVNDGNNGPMPNLLGSQWFDDISARQACKGSSPTSANETFLTDSPKHTKSRPSSAVALRPSSAALPSKEVHVGEKSRKPMQSSKQDDTRLLPAAKPSEATGNTPALVRPRSAANLQKDHQPEGRSTKERPLSAPNTPSAPKRPSSASAIVRYNDGESFVPTHAGQYSWIKGAEVLNVVEGRLFELGVDVRGRYHHCL